MKVALANIKCSTQVQSAASDAYLPSQVHRGQHTSFNSSLLAAECFISRIASALLNTIYTKSRISLILNYPNYACKKSFSISKRSCVVFPQKYQEKLLEGILLFYTSFLVSLRDSLLLQFYLPISTESH